MICPDCKKKYRKNAKKCSSCNVLLVDETTNEPIEEFEKLQTVLETGNLAIIAVSKSILDSAQVKYVVKGDDLQELFGIGRMGMGFNPLMGPTQIQVREQDVEIAKQLLFGNGEYSGNFFEGEEKENQEEKFEEEIIDNIKEEFINEKEIIQNDIKEEKELQVNIEQKINKLKGIFLLLTGTFFIFPPIINVIGLVEEGQWGMTLSVVLVAELIPIFLIISGIRRLIKKDNN